MKNALIEEILAPLRRVHRLMKDPAEKELLDVAISVVRDDLSDTFGDMLDPE